MSSSPSSSQAASVLQRSSGETGETGDGAGITSGSLARRLGVSPTTLRSWDQRYDLGPAGRGHGRHRRWSPRDVAMLEDMCRLTATGIPPAEAARVAKERAGAARRDETFPHAGEGARGGEVDGTAAHAASGGEGAGVGVHAGSYGEGDGDAARAASGGEGAGVGVHAGPYGEGDGDAARAASGGEGAGVGVHAGPYGEGDGDAARAASGGEGAGGAVRVASGGGASGGAVRVTSGGEASGGAGHVASGGEASGGGVHAVPYGGASGGAGRVASGGGASGSGGSAAVPGAATADAPSLPPLGTVRAECRGLARAAFRLDSAALQEQLDAFVRRHGVITAWEELMMPALHAIGRTWESGDRYIEVEHLLAWQVSTALRNARFLLGPAPAPGGDGSVLLACVPGEQHTLPLEAAAAALPRVGRPVRMLGAAVPAEALITAVRRTGPAAVLLWAQTRSLADTPLATHLMRTKWGPKGARQKPTLHLAGPGWRGTAIEGAAHPQGLREAVALLAPAPRR